MMAEDDAYMGDSLDSLLKSIEDHSTPVDAVPAAVAPAAAVPAAAAPVAAVPDVGSKENKSNIL